MWGLLGSVAAWLAVVGCGYDYVMVDVVCWLYVCSCLVYVCMSFRFAACLTLFDLFVGWKWWVCW